MSTASTADLRPKAEKHEAERFLCALDPDAAFFTFQTFDDNKERRDTNKARTGKDPFAHVIHGSLGSCWDRLARWNEQGAGVFVTINATDHKGRRTENIVLVRAVFIDLDGAPLEPVMEWREPQIVVESSPGQWHVYWIVAGIERDQFKPLQKALAEKFSGDPKVSDLPRVMRLPGFVHRKEQPFPSRLISTAERSPYTVVDLFPDGIPADDAAPRHSPPSDNNSYWAKLNSEALENLNAWVPALFPGAKKSKQGWRVSSKALGRDLEEDLSLTPQGIKDFGLHDMGDAREGRRSAIDIVMEYGDKDFGAAVAWLQQKLPSAQSVALGARLAERLLAGVAAKRAP